MTAKRARLVKVRKYWRKRNVLWHRANEALRDYQSPYARLAADWADIPYRQDPGVKVWRERHGFASNKTPEAS